MTDEFEEEHFEEKPFLEHLEDLRMTLLKIIATTIAAGLVCLAVSRQLLSVLKHPIRQYAVILSDQSPPPARGATSRPSAATEGQEQKSSPNVPQPGTRIVVTGPLGGFVMLTRDLFIYSKEALSSLNRYREKLGTPPAHGPPEKAAGSSRAVAQDKKKRSSVQKRRPVVRIIETGPAKGLVVVFKTAFLCGLGVAMPFNLFFLAQFIFPALTRKEKRYTTPFLLIGGFLFVLGVLFGYFITLPLGIRIFLQWNERYGIENTWKMSEYLSLITKLLIANGVVFEMPLVLTILVRLGVLTVTTLRKKRKQAMVIMLFISAILTPTVDGLTMMIVAAPMIVMYEACIWVSWVLMRKKKKREEEEEKRESYWEERKRIRRALKVRPEKEEKKETPTEQSPEQKDYDSLPEEHGEGYRYQDQGGEEKPPQEGEQGEGDLGRDNSHAGEEPQTNPDDENPHHWDD